MYMVQWILFERFKDMIRFLAQSFREKRIANFFDPQVNLLQWMDDDLLIQIGNYLTRIVNHENYADLFKKCDIPGNTYIYDNLQKVCAAHYVHDVNLLMALVLIIVRFSATRLCYSMQCDFIHLCVMGF